MSSSTTNFGFTLPAVNSATDEDLWGGELNGNWTAIDTYLLNAAPPGCVSDYAGSSAPAGWLLCYGQAVSRSTYANLFTAIGTTYGVGDGSTTFNVPDCRGRVGVGKDNMGGSAASRITTAICGIDGLTLGASGGDQSAQSHYHTIQFLRTSAATGNGTPPTRYFGNVTANALDYTASPDRTAYSDSYGDGAAQNVQPAIIFNKIIKT